LKKEHDSLSARATKGFSVAASPFNPIKRDLGVILLVGVLLLLLSGHLGLRGGGELWLLFTYGVVAAVWLAWHTRQRLHALERERGEGRDGAE